MAVLQDPNRPTAVNPAHLSRLSAIRTNSKDLCKDPERTEGYDRAYNQTFGAGKFTISVKGSDSFDFDMTDSFSFGGGYGGISAAEHELEEIKEFQEYCQLMELASGGDTDPWNDAYESNTLSFENDPHYFYTPAQYSYGGYSLDTSDPFTRDRVMNSKMVNDPVTGISYFDDGFSCSPTDGPIATLYTAAKRDLEGNPLDLTNKATLQMVQSAKVDPDTGSVITDTMCASPEYGQKIIEAKAQLDGTGPSSSAIASVTKSQPGHADVMSKILPLSSQAQIEIPGISAQGNDLFIATRGFESRGIIVAKPSTDASPVATTPTSPSITDGIAISQKSAPEFKAPSASPAPAPAPIV